MSEGASGRRWVVHPVWMTGCRCNECLTLSLMSTASSRSPGGANLLDSGRSGWAVMQHWLLGEGGGDDRFRDQSGRSGVWAGVG